MFVLPTSAPHGHGYAGVFIVFEGGDGAGKTTQLALLADKLADQEHQVLRTREPGGSKVGAAIRQVVLHGEHVDPRAEALLFAADRAHHVATVIRPALDQGAIVLCDRYIDSSIAYQGVARELTAHDVRSLSQWASHGLWPDLIVLLDVDPEQARRRRGSVHDRVESEALIFHQQVRAGFLDLAERDPERYLTLDAGQPIEVLHGLIAKRAAQIVRAQGRTS